MPASANPANTQTHEASALAAARPDAGDQVGTAGKAVALRAAGAGVASVCPGAA